MKSSVPPQLLEFWLSKVHGALCRRVEGALFVYPPAGLELLVVQGEKPTGPLVVLFGDTDRAKLETEARSLFGDNWLFAIVADDLEVPDPADIPHLSLRRALSELQTFLLESAETAPANVEMLAFFLKHGEYRSQHVSLRRAIYHVVPHEGGWRLKRQGQPDGESFSLKDDAVQAGAEQARSHSAGQLIIHAADGTFQEERTYGRDPSGSRG